MLQHRPRVSIGLPVFNGEQYLAAALDSLLNQTFSDFELIISDNASTDRTPDICREYLRRDSRVQYVREETNRGAPWNFNRVFQSARGQYFKWHAADDLCAPTLLERCVDTLDRDPTAVVCYPRTAVIDGAGNLVPDAPGSWRRLPGSDLPAMELSQRRGLESLNPHDRMRGILLHTVWCYELFGLIRHEAMRRTGLHRSSSSSGKVFLTELALQGRLVEVPEVLFYNRRHAAQYTMLTSAKEQQQFDRPEAESSKVMLPHQIHCTVEYARCIARGPVSRWQRVRCYGVLLRYLSQLQKWKRIIRGAWKGTGMWDGSLSLDETPLAEELQRSAEPRAICTAPAVGAHVLTMNDSHCDSLQS